MVFGVEWRVEKEGMSEGVTRDVKKKTRMGTVLLFFSLGPYKKKKSRQVLRGDEKKLNLFQKKAQKTVCMVSHDDGWFSDRSGYRFVG